MPRAAQSRLIEIVPTETLATNDRHIQISGIVPEIQTLLIQMGKNGWFNVSQLCETHEPSKGAVAVLSRTRRDPSEGAPIFDLDSAHDRLALLSELATRIRKGTTDASVLQLKRDQFIAKLPCSLYQNIAEIHCSFDIHINESELARRLMVSPSTLRRWFVGVGNVRPKRFLIWLQLHEIFLHAAFFNASIDALSLRLGFEYPESVRRKMRLLTGGAIRPSSVASEYDAFVRLVHTELR